MLSHTWRTIEQTVATVDDALLFVDPLADAVSVPEILSLRERYPKVGIVLYTTLDAVAMRAVVQLAGHGITDLVLFGFDDKPERIRKLIDEAHDATVVPLTPIENNLAQLPPQLRRAIEDMFAKPRCFRSTLDLAAAAGMSRRATFRHLKSVGFRSPRRLVASARTIRAYHLMRDGGRSATDVAKRLGYASVDQLSRHFTELAECTASDVRKGKVPTDFAVRVLHSLCAARVGAPRVESLNLAGVDS